MSISRILNQNYKEWRDFKPAHIERAEPQGFSPRTHRAPFETPLRVTFRDAHGETELPFDCVRTTDGWRNYFTRARLSVAVTGWRPA